MDLKIVDILVVNWNSEKKTLKAITPYINFKNEVFRTNIIVIDNASTIISEQLFQNLDIIYIKSERNLGFAGACNKGLKIAKGDFILLLNPDTISTPAHLYDIMSHVLVHQEIAISGPQQINENGEIQKTCGRFPSLFNTIFELTGVSKIFPKVFQPNYLMLDWNHQSSREVDHVMGSFMLIRSDVIKQMGFLDEQFFVYFEDLDFSKRVAEKGYKTFFNANVQIVHEGIGSGNRDYNLRLFYFLNSRRLYWKKYFNSMEVWLLIILSMTIEPLLRVLNSLNNKKGPKFPDVCYAYKRYVM